jgi:hypothetical protein
MKDKHSRPGVFLASSELRLQTARRWVMGMPPIISRRLCGNRIHATNVQPSQINQACMRTWNNLPSYLRMFNLASIEQKQKHTTAGIRQWSPT